MSMIPESGFFVTLCDVVPQRVGGDQSTHGVGADEDFVIRSTSPEGVRLVRWRSPALEGVCRFVDAIRCSSQIVQRPRVASWVVEDETRKAATGVVAAAIEAMDEDDQALSVLIAVAVKIQPCFVEPELLKARVITCIHCGTRARPRCTAGDGRDKFITECFGSYDDHIVGKSAWRLIRSRLVLRVSARPPDPQTLALVPQPN